MTMLDVVTIEFYMPAGYAYWLLRCMVLPTEYRPLRDLVSLIARGPVIGRARH